MRRESSVSGVVIAKVMGGLGNQLFIYAAAKRLSVMNDVPLKLDILSGYTEDEYSRTYGLHHFHINADKATDREASDLNLGKRKNLGYHINKFLPFGCKRYIREDKLFDPRLLDLRVVHHIYLDGYWQDENYFKDIGSIIRKDFEIASPHDSINIQLSQEMALTNSICLHARRLQYAHQLSAEYYESAIKYMAKEVINPHFYCFADDIPWIRDNINIDFPVTYVSHNDATKDYEDLWLMTQCKHHIIANSTFSWWGAWLCTNQSKTVIAPARWGYRAAVPKEWIMM